MSAETSGKSDFPPQVADNLPRDATGRVIPFGVERLYTLDGLSLTTICSFKLLRGIGVWAIEALDFDGNCHNLHADEVLVDKPEPPDSWEQLLKDLDRAADTNGAFRDACYYLTGDVDTECVNCKSYKDGRWCTQTMTADIARRIRELMEADENAD